jgi:hypothetical protein
VRAKAKYLAAGGSVCSMGGFRGVSRNKRELKPVLRPEGFGSRAMHGTPKPARGRPRALDLAPVLVQDPGLDRLRRLRGSVDGLEVVNVPHLRGLRRTRTRPRTMCLALGAAPD